MTEVKKTDDTTASEEEKEVAKDHSTEEHSEEEHSEEEHSEEEESDENADGSSDDDKKSTDDEIDYEAELAKEKELRIKAERKIAKDAFQDREKKRKEETKETEEESFTDVPLTRKDLESAIEERTDKIRKEIYSEKISTLVGSITRSDSEKNLVLEVHKNRVWPENMPLEQQIEESFAIANRKRILGENSELKRAMRSKETRSGHSGDSGGDSTQTDAPKISPADAEGLRKAGMEWDGTKRVYKSRIGKSNRFFFYDPKAKKRWTGTA